MTPQQNLRASAAAFAARNLTEELSSADALSKAACALGSSSLEFAAGGEKWTASDDYVRDKGALRWRESLARQCAAAALLLSEGLHKLAVHGSDAERDLEFSDRLTSLADELALSVAGLSECEIALRERLTDPGAALAALAQDAKLLRSTPVSVLNEMRRLAAAIDLAANKVATDERALGELQGKEEALRQRKAQVDAKQLRVSSAMERIESEIAKTFKRTEKEQIELSACKLELENAAGHAAKLRDQLKELSRDPRAEIVAAVSRAMRELPRDQFDRTNVS